MAEKMKSKEQHEAETLKWMERLWRKRWSSDYWMRSAKNLHGAAAILFAAYESATSESGEPIRPDDMEMDEPGTLLYGYAMENAIKGHLIAKLNLNSENARKLSGWSQHNLEELFGQTGIDATDAQRLLLKTLSAHIIWAGKYPASFLFNGQRGPDGFVLPQQFDHEGLEACQNMPPVTLKSSTRRKLDGLFNHLLEDHRMRRHSPGPHKASGRETAK
jgi:hypothetical protein